jgi:hypothetical protein
MTRFVRALETVDPTGPARVFLDLEKGWIKQGLLTEEEAKGFLFCLQLGERGSLPRQVVCM